MGAKLIVLGNRFEKNLLQNVYLNNKYKLLYEYHSYGAYFYNLLKAEKLFLYLLSVLSGDTVTCFIDVSVKLSFV